MGEKNDLLSAVASDDVVDCVEHLVEYLSCRVFGQAMYRHVTLIKYSPYAAQKTLYVFGSKVSKASKSTLGLGVLFIVR